MRKVALFDARNATDADRGRVGFFMLVCLLWACSSDSALVDNTGAGSGGSGGPVDSGPMDAAGPSGDAAPEASEDAYLDAVSGDARRIIDVVTTFDRRVSDRPPVVSDANDDANCELPTPEPVRCYVADSTPSPTPFARCARTFRQVVDFAFYFTGMRSRGGWLYWTEEGVLTRTNGTATEVVLAAPRPGYFEVDDDAVYFTYFDNTTYQTDVLRWNLDRSGLTTLATNIGNAFTMDDERIYFDTADRGVMATAKTGGGATERVAGPARVSQMTTHPGRTALIDATHIYWSEATLSGTTLKRMAKRTADVETLATDVPGHPVALLSDALLIVAESKYLLELPKSGECLRVLGYATDEIVADDRDIFWEKEDASGGRSVYRMPRSGGLWVEIVPWQPQGGNGRLHLALSPSQLFFAREDFAMTRIFAVDRP
jgi:hypothetical protein